MYLIASIQETKIESEQLSAYLKKSNIDNKVHIFSNVKNASLFVEKEWTKFERVIILDVDGIFPFMYLTKVHKLVVATITDVYSAYMTPLHNNTKVMIIPTSIIAQKLINKLSKFFIDAHFEAGRHMVRIDMLNKETE